MAKQATLPSKWVKDQLLVRSPALKPHIPTTLLLVRRNLSQLLNMYGMVYVKPVKGSKGIGVMRMDKQKGKWTVHDGMKRSTFNSFQAQYRWLRKRIKGEAYLVQRGIYVLKHNKRPIDFRVMIQKGKHAKWVVTGTAARVAHPQKAVTNGSQGGSIYPARALLQRKMGGHQATKMISTFHRIAHITAGRIARVNPRLNELGVDIAVDRHHRAWMLEVNTKPGPCPFTKLPDSTMLRRIIRYANRYGRTYSLKCNKARRGAK